MIRQSKQKKIARCPSKEASGRVIMLNWTSDGFAGQKPEFTLPERVGSAQCLTFIDG
jgi:hypothetical protein